jgi:hypothetical protein
MAVERSALENLQIDRAQNPEPVQPGQTDVPKTRGRRKGKKSGQSTAPKPRIDNQVVKEPSFSITPVTDLGLDILCDYIGVERRAEELKKAFGESASTLLQKYFPVSESSEEIQFCSVALIMGIGIYHEYLQKQAKRTRHNPGENGDGQVQPSQESPVDEPIGQPDSDNRPV